MASESRPLSLNSSRWKWLPSRHQAVARHGCGEAVVEDLAVVVAVEDGLPADAAIHDVLPGALVVLAR
jgi:hypothetical protein